jgi:hypothetical protein
MGDERTASPAMAAELAALATDMRHVISRGDEDRAKLTKIYDTVLDTAARTRGIEEQMQTGAARFDRHEGDIDDLRDRVGALEVAEEAQNGIADKVWAAGIALVSAAIGAAAGTLASGVHFVAGKWH